MAAIFGSRRSSWPTVSRFIRASLEAESCQATQSQGGHRMKLHANAALDLNGRRRLCERVIVEGWTVTKAAEGAEVSVRTARKWVRRLPR
jgi:leucine-zipper of insertion element IS481